MPVMVFLLGKWVRQRLQVRHPLWVDKVVRVLLQVDAKQPYSAANREPRAVEGDGKITTLKIKIAQESNAEQHNGDPMLDDEEGTT